MKPFAFMCVGLLIPLYAGATDKPTTGLVYNTKEPSSLMEYCSRYKRLK